MIVTHLFELKLVGYTIEIWLNIPKKVNKKLIDLNLKAWGEANDLVQELRGEIKARTISEEVETDEKIAHIPIDNVERFIQAYVSMQYKYTRVRKNYSINGKFYSAFAKASESADRLGVDYAKWIKLLQKHYSQQKRSEKITFPWPSQMHGDYAEQIVIQELARENGTVDPVLKGKKHAISNQYLPLKKDDYYISIREKIRRGTANEEDISYLETRQIQVYGEPKPWVADVKVKLFGEQKDG